MSKWLHEDAQVYSSIAAWCFRTRHGQTILSWHVEESWKRSSFIGWQTACQLSCLGHRMPNSFLIPYRSFAVPSRNITIHPRKAEEFRFLGFSFPSFQSNFALIPIQFFICIASPSFHVIDQNTNTVDSFVGG